ncbi:MAG: hypothetical protein ABIN91_15150 [Mucilaginibacter sp.]
MDKQVSVSFLALTFSAAVILSMECFLPTAPKKANVEIKQASNMFLIMALMTDIVN